MIVMPTGVTVVVWPTATAGYVLPTAAAPAAAQSFAFVNADGTPLQGVVYLKVECGHPRERIAEQPTTGCGTCLNCGKWFSLGEARPPWV